MITWQPGMSLAQLEQEVIVAAVRFHEGNKSMAAQSLGISPKTIYNKLESYGELQGETKGTTGEGQTGIQAQSGPYLESADKASIAKRDLSVRERDQVQEVPSKRASSGNTRK